MEQVRRMPWWLDAVLVGATWIVVGGGLLISRGIDWFGSWDQSLHAVAMTSIIVWPVAAGVGCARTVVLQRAGTASARVVAAHAVRAWLGGVAGCIVLTLVAGATALGLGSLPSSGVLPSLAFAVVGLLGAILLGCCAGLLAPRLVTAAVVVFVMYMVPNLSITGTRDVYAFAGASGAAGTALRLTPSGFWWIGAMLVSATAAFAVTMVLLAERGSSGRRRVAASAVLAVALFVGAFGSFVQVGRVSAADGLWTTAGRDAWSCERVGPGSTACLARDMNALRDDYFAAMGRLATLYDELEPGRAFVFSAQPVDGTTGLVVPMESTFSDPFGTWAAYATSDLAIRAKDLAQPERPPFGCSAVLEQVSTQMASVLTGSGWNTAGIRRNLAFLSACDE